MKLMYPSIKIFILFIFISSLSFTSNAATIMGHYTCGSYIKDGVEGGNEFIEYFTLWWVKGFLSGVNWADDEELGKGIDDDSISLAIEKYCRDNPLKDTADAVLSLFYNID